VSNQEGKKELDYNKKKKEIIKFLDSKDSAIMVLATSDEDRVIARNVLIANNEFDLYFFLWFPNSSLGTRLCSKLCFEGY